MKITKIKNYALIRTMVAYLGFVLALIYGYFSGSNASSITLLSFVLGVAFGPVIQWLVKTIRQTSLGSKLKTTRA
jgi:prepilin signal peptidase PulO-like enzyme (type II secretory pathway)